MNNIQEKVVKSMSLSKKIEMALHHAGLELIKKENNKNNIGIHPCLALAIQLNMEVLDMNTIPEKNMTGPLAPLKFRYTNHEGKTRVRSAVIKRIWFGCTKWHKEPQWMLRAFCTEHAADRDFALKDCDFLSFNADRSISKIDDKRPKHLDGTPLTDEEIKKAERAYHYDADGDSDGD